MDQPTYDYIFSGFGLAACLTLDAMLENGCHNGKQILILDQTTNSTDKTWCYWEQGKGRYDALLLASWTKGWFIGANQKRECLQSKLVYKSINSATLRNHLLEKISDDPNITYRVEKVNGFSDHAHHVEVVTEANQYVTKKLFNSIPKTTVNFGNTPLLLQHFEGWFIQSAQLPFRKDEMILMDFSVAQKQSTRFMYVLPFSDTRALIEYTLFSPSLIDKTEYEDEIRAYLTQHGITDFEIEKTESGVIPMTVFPFWKANTKNVLNIGTAGGWTKPGTGYTFMRAMQLSAELVTDLKNNNTDFSKFFKPNRFLWYDRLLIEVLYANNAIGEKLFTALFTRVNPVSVLGFLQQKTNFFKELPILLACPPFPFLKAAWRSVKRYKY